MEVRIDMATCGSKTVGRLSQVPLDLLARGCDQVDGPFVLDLSDLASDGDSEIALIRSL